MNELPQGWVNAALDDIAIVNPGRIEGLVAHTSVSFVPMPAVSDVDGEIANPTVRPFAEVSKGYTQFQEGDVIFAKITPCMENGKIAVARSLENGVACGSTEFHVVRPLGQNSPDYIWRFLRQNSYRADAEAVMTGAVGQRRVPAAHLKESRVPLPPLPEQRRIVAKIDSLTGKSRRARDHLDHIPRLVEKYKQAVLAAAFNSIEMAEWRQVQLESVLTDALIGLVRGKSDQSTTHGVPYIRMNHYDLDGRWNDDDLTLVKADAAEMARYELRDGDLLFNTRNSFELVGKVALWSRRPSGYLYNNNLLRLRFRPEVIPAFAFYQMISPQFRAYLHSEKSATTSVCAIYQRSIMAAPWAYPNAARQLEVANWIEGAFSNIDRLASETTSARRLIARLDQSVLAKAFRGELVPQDPEDEPASVLLERIRAERGAAPKAKRGRKAKVL